MLSYQKKYVYDNDYIHPIDTNIDKKLQEHKDFVKVQVNNNEINNLFEYIESNLNNINDKIQYESRNLFTFIKANQLVKNIAVVNRGDDNLFRRSDSDLNELNPNDEAANKIQAEKLLSLGKRLNRGTIYNVCYSCSKQDMLRFFPGRLVEKVGPDSPNWFICNNNFFKLII